MKSFLVSVGLAAGLALPASAVAQTPPALFFVPTVGATIGAGPGAVFSGTVGFKAGDRMQITGEFGGMTNVMPRSVNEDVEIAAAQVANTLGGKHSSDAWSKSTYGLVGIRRQMRDVSGAQTFLDIGVGMARVTSTVEAQIRGSASIQGDISNLVSTPFTAASPETKPMVKIGGGIVLGINHMLAVEMGARYERIFTSSEAINMANIFGGLRVGFGAR